MANSYSLKWLADYLECAWRGEGERRVSGLASLVDAQETDLSFLHKKQFAPYLTETKAGVVLVRENQAYPDGMNVIMTDDPYFAYAKLSGLFETRPTPAAGIHPSAVVHESAVVDSSASVGPNCVVDAHARVGKNTELLAGAVVGACVTIGADCVIFPNVVLYHGVTLGDRVRIHSGTVIGSDGFGFAPHSSGWEKIHQLGAVTVGNDVEIGANTAIDRGAIDDTEISDGVIIDNLVHIAHNVRIGKNTAIAGCVGIAGSTSIGANCTMGGFVAINGHLTVCDNVHFNGGSIVTKSVDKAGVYSSGTTVQDAKTWRKNAVRFGQLDQWVERIKALEKNCLGQASDRTSG